MITVSISINGRVIYARSARNVGGEDICKYRLDDGSFILHKRKNGAIKLAKKMLDTIKEVWNESKNKVSM